MNYLLLSMILYLFQIPDFNKTCVMIFAGENCEFLVGYMAVYRLTVGLVAFFLIMAVITLFVPSSDHWRASVQNGYVISFDWASREKKKKKMFKVL